MNSKITEITPLLQDIVNDNPSYDFPVNFLRDELFQLYLNQQEFDYFLQQCYKKLAKDYHIVFCNVFLSLMEDSFRGYDIIPQSIPNELYQQIIDRFIATLESLKITRVEKNTPDGELLQAMV